MKKLSFLTSLLLVMVLFVACDKNDEPKPQTGLTFNPVKAEVVIGKTQAVTVSGGTAPYTITVENNDIASATIDKNKSITVTGKKEGKTSITVTDSKKLSGKLTVEVKKEPKK